MRQNERAEAELLFLLGSLKHPNIVELLASYTQNSITNLLFPRADFDLHELFQRPRPQLFESDHVFFNAMRGLASGLDYIHNFRPRSHTPTVDPRETMRGAHHDIKPKNILIQGSNFILADFSVSRLKEDKETQTLWKDATFEYGAPECRDPNTLAPNMVGRALDIWSLGCVLSEVVTYMQKGPQGISKFKETRLRDGEYGKLQCFHDGYRLSLEVKRYLQDLAFECSFPIRDVISLALGMLAGRAADRPIASNIDRTLSSMTLVALADDLIELVSLLLGDMMSSRSQNVLSIRLLVEQNRLRAWADTLGLKSFSHHTRECDAQVYVFALDWYKILVAGRDALASERDFDVVVGDWEFKLNALRQTNDDLCKQLSAETKTSIDSTFFVITAHERNHNLKLELAFADLDLDQSADVSVDAARKYMTLLLEKRTREPTKNCRIEQSLIRHDDSEKTVDVFGPRTWLYSYGRKPGEEMRTLVEYMPYWEKNLRDISSSDFQKAMEAMFKRVEELVTALRIEPKPLDFRVLECLGIFHSPRSHRFGLVYSFPLQDTRPVKLNKLLVHGKSALVHPGISEKLALVKALVASVQSFHTGGWIHKSLSSLNVLFFPAVERDWDTLCFEKPYIVGFDHSRKDGKGEYTQGPILSVGSQEYLHPDYRTGRKEASITHDYYSLGLVLLEVGLWTSISNLYDSTDYQTHSPHELRKLYIDVCDQSLGKVMGLRYQRVTKRCLEHWSRDGGLEDQLVFQTYVVDELVPLTLD